MNKLAITTIAATLFTLSASAQTVPKPVQLKPLPSAPINLHMNEDAKGVYQALGKTLGLTVSFDPDYVSKVVQVDIASATPAQALQIVGELTGTFYVPVTPYTILVATNSRAKRSDLEISLDQDYDHAFLLKNATAQADANEVVAALRNMLRPEDRVYLVNSQDTVVVRAPAESIARAQTIIDELDKPKKNYRLTYTVTEVDGGKPVGTQHYAMVMASGQQTSLKLGNKVPIANGTFNAGQGAPQTQFSYLDVGMSFDASLTAMGENAILKSSVDDTSVAPEKTSIGGFQEPIVRQTSLKGESVLEPHKPQMLGSMDIPGSAGHFDIEVVMEPLP